MTFTRRKFNRKFRGGKKKTIRKKRKTRRKRRGGMNPQGADNNLPRPQQRQQTEEERLAEVRRQVNRMQMRRIEAARKARDEALPPDGAGGRSPAHLGTRAGGLKYFRSTGSWSTSSC